MKYRQNRNFSRIIFCFLVFLLIKPAAFAQNLRDLDSLYQSLAKTGSFNGCVLIAEDGKPIYEKAFGYANFEIKKPLNNQTIFELASVSKQFTSMAIMQLHQKNKVNYDDDITKYFPTLNYKGITIDNLLHHTSGVPEFLGWTDKEISTSQVNYNSDILSALIKNKKTPNFKTGEKFEYSNTNYVLLALIIEKVSGMSFSDYMEKNIFLPLNMNNTHIYAQRSTKKRLDNFAYGHIYAPDRNKFVINDSIAANKYQYYFDGITGPYGISSNVEDLLKWDEALYTEKLVSKSEQELAYLPSKLNNGKNASLMGMDYGYGWLVMPPSDYTGRRYMHSGGYPGYMSMITRYPDKRKTIIILTNVWNVVNMYQLNAATENILFNKPFTVPKPLPFQKSIILNPAKFKEIEGTYSLTPQITITINSEENHLYSQLTGQVKAEIYPESEDVFFYTIVPAKIKFEMNKDGVVKKLVLLQNGKEFSANKN